MTIKETSEDLVVTKDSIKTAMMLKQAFEVSIEDYPSDYIPLSSITPLLPRLKGLHLLIYQNVLEPYSNIAGSGFIKFWNAYSDKEWNLLRKHHSRMTSALESVAREERDIHTDEMKVQLKLVDQYLVQGLHEMFKDMPWMIKHCAKVIVTIAPQKEELLEEISEREVRVISPDVRVSMFRTERDQALADAAEARARADKDRADTAKAIADAAEDRARADKAIADAAKDRARADKAIADAAEDRARADKARADAAKDRAKLHSAFQIIQGLNSHRGQPATPSSFSDPSSPGLFASEKAKPEGQEDTFEAEPGNLWL